VPRPKRNGVYQTLVRTANRRAEAARPESEGQDNPYTYANPARLAVPSAVETVYGHDSLEWLASIEPDVLRYFYTMLYFLASLIKLLYGGGHASPPRHIRPSQYRPRRSRGEAGRRIRG
jgi:hypothetical protein